MSFRPPRSLGPGPADMAFDALGHELMQEKASTLGRLTREFEKALADLAAFDPAAEAGAEHRRAELLEAAADALWWFVVQREACGMRNTDAVLRDYKVPAAVRLRMGVVRKR